MVSVYGTFALAVAIQGAIDVRTIAFKWGGPKSTALEAFMRIKGLDLFTLGARAVWATTFG